MFALTNEYRLKVLTCKWWIIISDEKREIAEWKKAFEEHSFCAASRKFSFEAGDAMISFIKCIHRKNFNQKRWKIEGYILWRHIGGKSRWWEYLRRRTELPPTQLVSVCLKLNASGSSAFLVIKWECGGWNCSRYECFINVRNVKFPIYLKAVAIVKKNIFLRKEMRVWQLLTNSGKCNGIFQKFMQFTYASKSLGNFVKLFMISTIRAF